MSAGSKSQTTHKHLFTPGDWCMRPYSAQFGLTKEQVKATPALESVIMDQYARDCGFEPTESWVLVVRPSGSCEFTVLKPGDSHWCCERSEAIQTEIGPATNSVPPYHRAHDGGKQAPLRREQQKNV